MQKNLTGTFDNLATWRRETYYKGDLQTSLCGLAISTKVVQKLHAVPKWGSYPDLPKEETPNDNLDNTAETTDKG